MTTNTVVGAIITAAGAPSSVFNPGSIAGLAVWLDADDAASFSYSSGVKVSQWNDKSGNSRHFSQGTVGNQPNRNGSQNGRTTVVYNRPTAEFVASGAFNLAVPYTIYIACELQNNPVSPLSSNVTYELQIYTFGSFHGFTDPSAGPSYNPGGVAAEWDPAVFTYTAGSGANQSTIHRNNSLMATGTIVTNITVGLRTCERGNNGSEAMADAIYEIIAYSGAHSPADRATVNAYLRGKWGTP